MNVIDVYIVMQSIATWFQQEHMNLLITKAVSLSRINIA